MRETWPLKKKRQYLFHPVDKPYFESKERLSVFPANREVCFLHFGRTRTRIVGADFFEQTRLLWQIKQKLAKNRIATANERNNLRVKKKNNVHLVDPAIAIFASAQIWAARSPKRRTLSMAPASLVVV